MDGKERGGMFMIKHDPMEEVKYRARLAKGYLDSATRLFQLNDWRGVVANAQLAAENAAKAIISLFREPSWSHDPSLELSEIKSNLPTEYHELIDELAMIAHRLAPEHARSTYGEPSLGLTPWDIYKEADARKALDMAKRSIKIMEKLIEISLISIKG